MLLLVGLILFCAASPLVLYPLAVWLAALLTGGGRPARPGPCEPTVSLITIVRNGKNLLARKLDNSLALDYPADKLHIVVYSDGSTDGVEKLPQLERENVTFVQVTGHRGKNLSLNEAGVAATGDILLFSDADAMLAPDALRKMVPWFADTEVGAVCGRRVIGETGSFASGQAGYISFDSRIKELESRIGSISSNDGKIYAIRKELFQPIYPAATDDLYNSISIILHGKRVVFAPDAHAIIKTPSRNPKHEIGRRRRIVNRSFSGIFSRPRVLNPFRTGLYAIGLFFNKVMRRLLPVFLLALLAVSFVGATQSVWVALLLGGQMTFYAVALAHFLFVEKMNLRLGKLMKLSAAIFYFTVGNIGVMMGVLDFLGGKEVVKWDPVKKSS